MEETRACDVRYLRISGQDVYGFGPSERAWRFDLRKTPTERRTVVVDRDKRCQGSHALQQQFVESRLLEPGSDEQRWVPDVAAWSMGFGAYPSSQDAATDSQDVPSEPPASADAGGSCLAYPCERLSLADPCTMMVLRTTLDSRNAAMASALTIVFVTILLGASSSNFGALTNRLVIVPLEGMTAMVRGLMADPMAKMQEDADYEADSETKAIASALIKLSTMLQIAFGEAGRDIITTNLNSGTEVNALIAGKRLQVRLWSPALLYTYAYRCYRCLLARVTLSKL